MRQKKAPLFALFMLAALPALAQTPPIRPGLWEMTPGQTLMDGKPLPGMADMSAQLAKLPPELRKKMQAQGVDLGGDGKVKMCISAEMLKQDRWQQQQQGCTMTVSERSSSTWRWKGRCTQPPGDMEGVTTFSGDTAYRTQIQVTQQRDGRTHVMSMDGSSRWLGADCGAIKPMPLPAAK